MLSRRYSQQQIGSTYFIPLNSVFLSSACRLIELNYLLLQELVPLHEQYLSHNPRQLSPYSLPPSISKLFHKVSERQGTKQDVLSLGMEIEEIDDDMIAM